MCIRSRVMQEKTGIKPVIIVQTRRRITPVSYTHLAEVDTLFARMYEDWAAGRITEYNFNMLSGKYQSEQAELEEKIEQLQSAIAAESQSAADAEKWIALMKECVNPTELTAELLNTLIEKILVHEAVKNEDGSREQEVEIFYRFIGKID